MLGGFFPWSVFLPQALFKACLPAGSINTLRASSGLLAKAQTWFKGIRELQGQADLRLYAAVWAVVTLLFFSTSVSKLLTYTVPAFAALAILVSIEIISSLSKISHFDPAANTKAREIERQRAYISLLVPFAILAISYGLAGLFGPLLLKKLRQAPPELFAITSSYITVQCLISFSTVVLFIKRYMKTAIAVFAVSTLISSGFFGIRAVTSISNHWEGPLPGLAQYCALTGEPIFVFDLRKPSVPFYSHCQVIEPGSQEDIAQRLPFYPRAYIITKPRGRDFLLKTPGSKLVVERGPFVLMHWVKPEV
jgi:4-amino-4-deoxy-L-arabinose transferase-like glycosyltransferase